MSDWVASIQGYLAALRSAGARAEVAGDGLRQSVLPAPTRRGLEELGGIHGQSAPRRRFGRRARECDRKRGCRRDSVSRYSTAWMPKIAFAMMSINAVKGVEIGAGFAQREPKGQRASRRDHAAGLSLQQCRRRVGRHFLGPGHPGEHRAQADLQHHRAGPIDRPGRQSRRGGHHRTARPMCRTASHAHRRGACWRWC